jgi:hypothetical protein
LGQPHALGVHYVIVQNVVVASLLQLRTLTQRCTHARGTGAAEEKVLDLDRLSNEMTMYSQSIFNERLVYHLATKRSLVFSHLMHSGGPENKYGFV